MIEKAISLNDIAASILLKCYMFIHQTANQTDISVLIGVQTFRICIMPYIFIINNIVS